MPSSEIQSRLLSVAPGAIAQGFTDWNSHGAVTDIHRDLDPYVRPLQLKGGRALRDISQMVDTLTLALPSPPPFNFFYTGCTFIEVPTPPNWSHLSSCCPCCDQELVGLLPTVYGLALQFFLLFSLRDNKHTGRPLRALQPWVTTNTVFMGDVNHVQLS